ncbi:MAG: hypothetical protein Q9210_002886 [Variospora velana]
MLRTALPFSLLSLALSALLIPPTHAYPNCNPELYGTPDDADCHDIFFDRPQTGNKGLASLDKYTHYFGAAGNPSVRPADVERRHWARRVNLPRVWHDGTSPHFNKLFTGQDIDRGGKSGECSALLSPDLTSTGQPKYETGKYADIAESSTYIEMACAFHDGTSIRLSGGSMDAAGPHFRLTLILYHPRSRFADAIKADVAAGRIIDYGAITLADPADANANRNPFLDPTIQETGDTNQAESSSSGANRASAALAQCGRKPYCSRVSDCSIGGCRCVADGGINFWSASCRAVLADAASAVGSGVGRGLLEKNNTSNNSASASSLDSSAGVESKLVGGDLPDLPCPCNCTYVSKQCCNSDTGIVYEEPANHLGSLRAPMGDLECDRTTGEWKPKTSTN